MGLPQPTAAAAVTFGKYTLVAKLAKGGMAEIVLARLQGAAGFEKLVCIKRILPHLAEDAQFVSMFLSEARIAALISHPNVCQVFELGELDGSYFIAMEYLEGVPLAAFRRADMYPMPPDPQLVVGIGIQACEGLHHAHELTRPDGGSLDVVHRDVSAQNLFVTTSGVVKVLDFGIAKIQDASMRTTTGAVKGTYAYMAPEQLRGEAIDRRTDVFAMGIVMWETLAQRHLFRKDTDFLTFQAITSDPIPDIQTLRPDVPPAVAAAIMKALARDKTERFPTARAFGEAMTRAMAPLGGPAGASAISEELARAFDGTLAEQRALVRIAREGRAFDLHEDQGPRLGHGTAMLVTPTSGIPAVPVASVSQIPSGPRSETLSVTPLPPDLSLRSPRRWAVIAGIAIAAAAAIALVVHLGTGGSSERPRATESSTVDEPTTVVMTAEGSGSAASAAATASEPAVEAATPVTTPPVASPPTAPSPPPAEPPARARRPDRPLPTRTAIAKAPGFLTIDSSPVYADITIDGKRYGETPLFKIQLAPGRHVIRATTPSKKTRVERVTIESGKVAVRRLEW